MAEQTYSLTEGLLILDAYKIFSEKREKFKNSKGVSRLFNAYNLMKTSNQFRGYIPQAFLENLAKKGEDILLLKEKRSLKDILFN